MVCSTWPSKVAEANLQQRNMLARVNPDPALPWDDYEELVLARWRGASPFIIVSSASKSIGSPGRGGSGRATRPRGSLASRPCCKVGLLEGSYMEVIGEDLSNQCPTSVACPDL